MKVITIGRDRTQDICYDNEMISRRHAILRVYNNGKMEIVSLGQNGTFVNGNLCKPNAHYPLKRNDVVSFAHVCELDWSEIPNPLRWLKITSLILGIVAIIATLLVLTYDYLPFVEKEFVEEGIEMESANETPEFAPNNWTNRIPKNDGFSNNAPEIKDKEKDAPEAEEKDAPKSKAEEKEEKSPKANENSKFKKYFKDKDKNKEQNKKKQDKQKEKNDSTTAIGNMLI